MPNAESKRPYSPRTEYRVGCSDPEGHLLSPTGRAQAETNARALNRSTNLTCGPHIVEVRTVYLTPWEPDETPRLVAPLTVESGPSQGQS